MGEIIISNLDKLIPAVKELGGKIGSHVGEAMNDAIDKAFEKVIEIVKESPVARQ